MFCIHLTTYNRKELTFRSIKNMKKCISSASHLFNKINGDIFHIHDDNSSEYNLSFLAEHADLVTKSNRVGIQEIMLNKLLEFKHIKFDYLYHFDNDVLHDINALEMLFTLHQQTHLPVTLLNTKYHSYENNILERNESYFIQKSFSGTSLFLSKNNLLNIQDSTLLDLKQTSSNDWDWHISKLLGKFVCPKDSYSDHYITSNSLHTTYDDVGRNLTPFLTQQRNLYK